MEFIYWDWQLAFIRCITTKTSVRLSVTHVGITNEEMARGYLLLENNEEMGEAGLEEAVQSEIELTSILALGDARWRVREVWVQ